MGSAVSGLPVVASVLKAILPKQPKAPKPIPMPDPEAQEEARRRQIASMQSRSGRASTILSEDETLG